LARSSSDTARNGEGALLVSAVPPDLCLGYVNTLSWRGRSAPAETLRTISDVLGWIERAAVFSPGAVDHAAAWAQDNEAQAARTFAEAIKLREALFGIFSAIGAAEPCDRSNFLIFGAALARAPQRCHLVPMQCRFAWSIARTRNPASDALTPVLWSAADLMLGAPSHRIRRCANEECLWLFLDQSKTNTRRWCDMGSCGNRAKSRRHYAKAASSRRSAGNPG
jgi:predicted RNA-binding Zn ribbon-like protein